jgi:MarR family
VTVPATVQETVNAVAAPNKQEVSLGELAAKLGLDKSVTSRRVRDATDRGYVVNLETRRGRPARIVLGDPMPETVKLLPEPSELA